MKPAPRKGSVVAAGPTGLKSSLQAAAPKQGSTAASPKSPKRTSWAMRPAEDSEWFFDFRVDVDQHLPSVRPSVCLSVCACMCSNPKPDSRHFKAIFSEFPTYKVL